MDVDDSKEVDLEEFQRFWITEVLPLTYLLTYLLT